MPKGKKSKPAATPTEPVQDTAASQPASKTISYNSSVAQLCKKKGITKAVLLNYIYNYHKANIRKGAGTPAAISLSEFVYTYTHGDEPLWKKTFIQKALKELEKQKLLKIELNEGGQPVYSVSDQVAKEFKDGEGTWISFDLGLACRSNIYIAIIHRFLSVAIKNSPNEVAYNLDIEKIAETNCISVAEHYRLIKEMVKIGFFKKVKSPVRKSRGMNLAKGDEE